jgi:hypothetical protein
MRAVKAASGLGLCDLDESPSTSGRQPEAPEPLPKPSIESLDALAAVAFGAGARVIATTRLEPWAVMRCAVAGAGAPATAIVKWLRDDPNGFRVDPRQIATEQAALEFLAAIGFAGVPRLYAADREANLLLVEDLAPRRPLADRIRAEGPDALEASFFAFARLCGDLGAATAGHEAHYEALRRAYGEVDPLATRLRGFGPLWPTGRAQLAAAGFDIAAPVAAEMQSVLAMLREPGPFFAFTGGDAYPNNVMVGGGDARLIDFEAAAFRHALAPAAWIHMPGSMWITVASPRSRLLEAAFRAALAEGVPEAADERLFGAGMAAVCLCEAAERLSRFAILDARPPGHDSRLQMVFTLDAAVVVARAHGAFPRFGGWCEWAGAWLRRRWPDADRSDIAPYTPRR